jgi:hypothetical protein
MRENRIKITTEISLSDADLNKIALEGLLKQIRDRLPDVDAFVSFNQSNGTAYSSTGRLVFDLNNTDDSQCRWDLTEIRMLYNTYKLLGGK